jgi:hypothetical protein
MDFHTLDNRLSKTASFSPFMVPIIRDSCYFFIIWLSFTARGKTVRGRKMETRRAFSRVLMRKPKERKSTRMIRELLINGKNYFVLFLGVWIGGWPDFFW